MQSSPLRSAFILLPVVLLTLSGCGSMKSTGSSPSDIALAEENYRLKADQEKLRKQLAEAKASQVAATPGSAGEMKEKLDVAEEKLSHALRSYTQSQEEIAHVQADLDKSHTENSALASQVKELTAKLASGATGMAPPAPLPATPAPSAANPDTESNLATTLRSYALLREESDQTKSDRDKLAAEKVALLSQISALKGAMPLAAQAEGLREQLRQTQAQSAAFAEENSRLKTLLSNNGVPSAASAAHPNVVTPMTVATAPDPTPTPTPVPTTPEARVHTVVAGDTLSKIALKYYGSASRWPEILAANRDTMRNENSLVAGHKIRIP